MDSELLAQARRVGYVIGCRVRLRVPSVLVEGEQFALKISVTGPDALPVDSFPCSIRFENCRGVAGLPESYRLPPDSYTGQIPGLRCTGSDVVLIRAIVEMPDTSGIDTLVVANPAWVFSDPPYRIFWGDLHVHTEYSNCHRWRCQDPEWCYQYARDVSLLDFVAPADHLRGIASESSRWPRLQKLARQYNVPGEFVSFLAFESSHAPGHGGDNNVYYRDDEAPYFWVEREDMHGIAPEVHLTHLWDQLDDTGKKYFTVPHHTGRSWKYRSWDEDYHDPECEPLFEIYSSWGSSEKRPSRFPMNGGGNEDVSFYVDALRAGARFGVIASSDDHATLPGGVHHHRTQPFRPPPTDSGYAHKGLAAIRSPLLERKHLFDCMRARDTYGTTDALSLLDVYVNDAGMGEEIPCTSELRRKRRIEVRYTPHDAASCRVVLMRNGEELMEERLQGEELVERVNTVLFEDDEPLEEAAIRGAKYHPEPFVVYYVRVRASNGAQQWSSPVWIDL